MLKDIYKLDEWNSFLNTVKEGEYPDELIIKNIERVIENIDKIDLNFGIPEKKIIKKYQDSKPRIVYSYKEPYNTYLRFINWKLQYSKYSRKFSKSSIAYQRNKSINYYIKDMHKYINKYKDHEYIKIDFTNFFNSIDINILETKMNKFFDTEDKDLSELIIGLLKEPRVSYEEEIIYETDKGVMAGTPLAGYLSNIYMNDLDIAMNADSILYRRYADDIIILTPSERKDRIKRYLDKAIYHLNLSYNPLKEEVGLVKDGFDFLGYNLTFKEIDINRKAIDKMKKRIKRRAKWFRKNTSINYYKPNYKIAARVFVRGINNKLYTRNSEDGTCWMEWYGKSITTDKSLKEIESYMKQYIRYILSGKHKGYKKNSEIEYEYLKKLGYKSLVNYYWKGMI